MRPNVLARRYHITSATAGLAARQALSRQRGSTSLDLRHRLTAPGRPGYHQTGRAPCGLPKSAFANYRKVRLRRVLVVAVIPIYSLIVPSGPHLDWYRRYCSVD